MSNLQLNSADAHAFLILGDFCDAAFIKARKLTESDVRRLSPPIKIQHVRELIHWLYLKPHSSTHKLAVLREAQSMTVEAANALLKILEEPPASAIIILQADKKEKILPTILSRCQVMRGTRQESADLPADYQSVSAIRPLSVKEKFDYVAKIAEAENIAPYLNHWEEELRLALLQGEDKNALLQQIAKTRALLSTNTSVKLLLENLVLKF